MAKSRVVQRAEGRLGIRIEPGHSAGSFWLHYGHSRGSEWFPTEAEALNKLDDYLTKRQDEMAKELVAMGALLRWAVTRRLELEG